MNAGWRVVIPKSVERELRRLHPVERARVRAALDAMAADPFSGDIRKVRGAPGEWARRVGDVRIRFRLDPARRAVVITHVRPRGDAYRP